MFYTSSYGTVTPEEMQKLRDFAERRRQHHEQRRKILAENQKTKPKNEDSKKNLTPTVVK